MNNFDENNKNNKEERECKFFVVFLLSDWNGVSPVPLYETFNAQDARRAFWEKVKDFHELIKTGDIMGIVVGGYLSKEDYDNGVDGEVCVGWRREECLGQKRIKKEEIYFPYTLKKEDEDDVKEI